MLVVEEAGAYVPGGTLPAIPGGTADGLPGSSLCGPVRGRVRSALYEVLPPFLTGTERNTYTVHLEACATAFSGNDYPTYISMMARVVFNMKLNGEHLVKTYPVSKICRLSNKRLRALTAHAERDDATEQRLQSLLECVEIEAEAASKAASAIQNDAKITCPKCKTTEGITCILAQLRRGDEGMTTRCMCKCGNTWNMAS
jgi:DNA-directed RNA polymerase subunit M/transcription elongation factor TFIIS